MLPNEKLRLGKLIRRAGKTTGKRGNKLFCGVWISTNHFVQSLCDVRNGTRRFRNNRAGAGLPQNIGHFAKNSTGNNHFADFDTLFDNLKATTFKNVKTVTTAVAFAHNDVARLER